LNSFGCFTFTVDVRIHTGESTSSVQLDCLTPSHQILAK